MKSIQFIEERNGILPCVKSADDLEVSCQLLIACDSATFLREQSWKESGPPRNRGARSPLVRARFAYKNFPMRDGKWLPLVIVAVSRRTKQLVGLRGFAQWGLHPIFQRFSSTRLAVEYFHVCVAKTPGFVQSALRWNP